MVFLEYGGGINEKNVFDRFYGVDSDEYEGTVFGITGVDDDNPIISMNFSAHSTGQLIRLHLDAKHIDFGLLEDIIENKTEVTVLFEGPAKDVVERMHAKGDDKNDFVYKRPAKG